MLPDADVFSKESLWIEFEGLTLNVYRFSRISDPMEWDVPLHAHKNYELHYIYAGRGSVCLGMDRHEVGEGDFYICEPFLQHSQHASQEEPMQEYCVECEIRCQEDATAEKKRLSQVISHYGKCCSHDGDGAVLGRLRELERLYKELEQKKAEEEKTVILETYVKSLMLSVVLYMLTAVKQDRGKEKEAACAAVHYQRAVSIRNYLESNLLHDVSIKECARVFYLSERQIDRIMLDQYHVTFHQYLQKLRTEVAVRLLSTTSLEMERVAEHSGFGSYRNMIRNFKKYQNRKPSEVRREALRERLQEENV